MTNGIDPNRINARQNDETSGNDAHVVRARTGPAEPLSAPDLPPLDDDPLARTLQARKAGTARAEAPVEKQEPAEAKRLDAFRDAARGPYVVDGKRVFVAPPFRMVPGYSAKDVVPKGDKYLDQVSSLAGARTELQRIAPRVQLTNADVEAALYGRASPQVLCKLTQALISEGNLPAEGGSVEQRIRRMQFHYCLGFDCAGYTQLAFAASRGVSRDALPLQSIYQENLDLDRSATKAFTKVPWSAARAGDIIVLGVPKTDPVGHRAIIARTRSLSADETKSFQAIAAKVPNGPQATILKAAAHVTVYEVDSSWGCGGDPRFGGVRRELWYHDESSDRWVWTRNGDLSEGHAIPGQPYDHPVTGVYTWAKDH